ncbi:MAG: hypothetical protein QM770_10710 [Tepidisphaeraceae bacterium]
MAQQETKLNRFAGPALIQELDHNANIPQVDNQNEQGGRQQDQRQAKNRQQGAKRDFNYQNPRQYS